MPISINNSNLQEILSSKKPVVVDVFALWCGPCQQVAPIFDELEKELGSTYTFAKINVDEARDVSINFGITSIPTFIFIKDGAVKGKETGYMSKEDLKDKINEYLG